MARRRTGDSVGHRLLAITDALSHLADEVVGGSSVTALVQRQPVGQAEVGGGHVHHLERVLQLEAEQERVLVAPLGPTVESQPRIGEVGLVEQDAVVEHPTLSGTFPSDALTMIA